MKRIAVAFGSVLLGLLPAVAAAEPKLPDPARLRATGRLLYAGPSDRELVRVAAAGGWAYTESVLGLGDSHQRVMGTLAAEGRLLPWLGLGLRLDGRWDKHSYATMPSDDGLVGDPRLFVRLDRAATKSLRLGAHVGVWLPGADAPSVKPAATSVDAFLLASWVGEGGLFVGGQAGFRLDRSAKAAPADVTRLEPGDRLALGLSRSSAALVGVGGGYRTGRVEVHGGFTWDVHLGSEAPSASQSPMFIDAGVRVQLASSITGELLAQVSPSSRPKDLPPTALVPIPPRFGVLAAVSWAWSKPEPVVAPPPPPPPPVETKTRLTGRVRVAGSDELVSGAVVTVTTAEGPRTVTPDPSGRFELDDLPVGRAEVKAEREGFAPSKATITLSARAPAEVELALTRALPPGQLRGTVRSFGGKSVDATISIEPGGQTVRVVNGTFQLDTAPGAYDVTITASGYESQTRRVSVEQNGVTVINVDLRRAR